VGISLASCTVAAAGILPSTDSGQRPRSGDYRHPNKDVKLAHDRWRQIKKGPQRWVLCRLMIDLMRTVHVAYAPASEPFGTRLETFFIGFCVAIGDIDGKPFSVAKIAAYMRVPRTTVIRRLDQLQSWGLIDRRGRHYYLRETTLNSANGMRTYQKVRRILSEAIEELSVFDTLPDLQPGPAPHRARATEAIE
jgi:biotin operon repressor